MKNNNALSFVRGFTKQAQLNGLTEQEALQLCVNTLGKHADFSEVLNSLASGASALGSGIKDFAAEYPLITGIGLPAMLGAGLGSTYKPVDDKELLDDVAYTQNPSLSKALKYIAAPGLYAGYRYAKNDRVNRMYEARLAEKQQQMAAAARPQLSQANQPQPSVAAQLAAQS